MTHDDELLAKLDQVAAHRRRFAPALQALLPRAWARLPAEGPLLELGAGDEQLSRWLDPERLSRAILTEPSASTAA